MPVLINKGELDLAVLTTMGVSVKTQENPIGCFGTGLKYAIAILLRNGIDIQLNIGTRKYSFYSEKCMIRGKDFNVCKMQGAYDSIDLGFTDELGKHWEPWQAYREIASNCLDEGGSVTDQKGVPPKEGTTQFCLGEIPEADTVFLRSEEKILLHKTDALEIYEGASNYIYYRGIRAKSTDKETLYTYNILETCELTEDRCISYDYVIQEVINDAVAVMENKDLIKGVITAPRTRYESGLHMGYNNRIAPGKVFQEVCGDKQLQCNPTARAYITQHTEPKEPTPEERAERFRQQLADFCRSHSVAFSFDHVGFVTLDARHLLKPTGG